MSIELPESEKTTLDELEQVEEVESVEEVVSEEKTSDDPFAAFENPHVRTKEDLQGNKQRKKRTIILSLIAAFVVLCTIIVLLVFVFPKQEEETPDITETTTITLFDKSTSAVSCPIKSATVAKKDSTPIEFVNIDDRLYVKGYENFEMHATNMGDLVDALTICVLSKDIGEVEDVTEFGLDDPQFTVTVTFYDDTTKTFEVGDMTPDQSGCYFREKDSKHIYIQPLETTSIFLQQPLDYISLTVLEQPTVKSSSEGETEVVLRYMSLSGEVRKNRPFSFRLVTSEDSDTYIYYSYIITEPFTKGANSSYDTALGAFTAIDATSVVNVAPTAADLKTYGLDKPYSVAKFTLSARTTTTMESDDGNTISKTTYKDLEEHTLMIGNKYDAYYYVRIDDNPVVYLVAADALPIAEMQYDDLADTLLFLEDISEMGSFRLTFPDKETIFNLKHDDSSMDSTKNLTVTIDGKTYDTMDFRYLVQNFMNIKRYGSLTTDVSKMTPQFEMAITRREQKTPVLSVKFYEISGSQYAVVLSNGESYQVTASDVKNAVAQYENYLAGKTVLY